MKRLLSQDMLSQNQHISIYASCDDQQKYLREKPFKKTMEGFLLGKKFSFSMRILSLKALLDLLI